MDPFRRTALGQVRQLEEGQIFSFKDLSFGTGRTAGVAVLLSGQYGKGNHTWLF